MIRKIINILNKLFDASLYATERFAHRRVNYILNLWCFLLDVTIFGLRRLDKLLDRYKKPYGVFD